ncbi:MAG: VWA domain-containing protein [Candidatus Acidiferrales bacterium]
MLVAMATLATPPAHGQAPAGPLKPKPGVKEEKIPPGEARRKAPIRVRVNLVSTPVTVRDKKGELVFNLQEKDFKVFDNGREEKIQHFDLGGDLLSVVFVVETSSHIEPILPAIRRTGIVFTQTVMAKTAEAAVVSFDDEIDLLAPFTSDQEQIQRAINTLKEGTSGIKLYDGLERAVQLLKEQPENRRRVILAISESADTGSEVKLGEVLRQAQLANITIYTIGLSTTAAELRAPPSQAQAPRIGPPGTRPLPPLPGRPATDETDQQRMGNIDLLSAVIWLVKTAENGVGLGDKSLVLASTATGGLHLKTMRDRSIEKAMDEIGGELHAQYVMDYQLPSSNQSGYHEIQVTVAREGVDVRSRPGYYIAPPPE